MRTLLYGLMLISFLVSATVHAKSDSNEQVSNDWDNLSTVLGRFEANQASEADVKRALSKLSKDGIRSVEGIKPEDYKTLHVASNGSVYTICSIDRNGKVKVLSGVSDLAGYVKMCDTIGVKILNVVNTGAAK